MPEITVSDSLYNKLEEAAQDNELDDALWEMVYLFERGNNPAE
ncbi:phosphohydrolase [Halostella litorea]|nr:phosphohydrolase [Halostella litorea]